MDPFTLNVKIGIKMRELLALLQKSEAPEARKVLDQIELAYALWSSTENQKTQQSPQNKPPKS